MGLFDNIKKKNEAKRLGLTVEQYDEYRVMQEKGIALDEYKRYLASYSAKYSADDFLVYLQLERVGFNETQCQRFLAELASKIKIEDYKDFLDAEQLGLSVAEYAAYAASMKTRMSAVEYVGFLKAQKIGITMGKYLQYLRSFKEEMTIEEYDTYLKAEENGMDREHYREYLEKFKDTYTVERYLEFDKARSLGMTLEEYDLRIEAANKGMTLEAYRKHLEAKKLSLSDEAYGLYLKLADSNCIVNGTLRFDKDCSNVSKGILQLFDFQKVEFSAEINEIPDGAFEDCISLIEIAIPAQIRRIGEDAFKGCSGLESITIEAGVEEIKDSAFEDCKLLKTVYIPGTVKDVGYHVFHGCSQLESIEFAYGVESIDVSEWVELPKLSQVLTPASASIRHLPPYRKGDARYGVINAEQRIRISNDSKVDYVTPERYAEYGLEENRKTIEYLEVHGDYVFIDLCDFPNLKTVDFSAKGCVRNVENCPALQMILYSNYLAEIPSGYVASAKEREEKIVDIKTLTMRNVDAPALRFVGVLDGAMVVNLDDLTGTKLAWVHLCSSVSRFAFNSEAVTSAAVHGNCKISSESFDRAAHLRHLRFDQDSRENGVYSNATARTIVSAEFLNCEKIDIAFMCDTFTAEHFGVQGAVRFVSLPKDLKKIEDNAFEQWGLEEIEIPETVTVIGNNVFAHCKALTSVVFNGLPEYVGSDVFEGCTMLERITIEGRTIFLHDFIETYETKSVTVADEEIHSNEEIETTSGFAANMVYEEQAPADETEIVNVKNQFVINLQHYTYSVEPTEIGENRAVVAVRGNDNLDVANPYAATESITVLIGSNISSISEAEKVAATIGLENSTIVKTEQDVDVRYVLKECSDSLTIYLALICTKEKTFPAQFFFNNSLGEENEAVVLSVLQSVCACPVDANNTLIETQIVAEEPQKTGCIEKQQAAGDKSTDIPVGVLYRPGEEPERIRQRIERLFEKLDSAYPDKVIVGLYKDHKKWGETVTDLYRQLGYPDGNSFLSAYGYRPGVSSVGGRPSSNPMEVVNELKRRYSNGPVCATIAELQKANPDLASRFSNMQNQADKFFGMTLVKYFIQEGILIGKTQEQVDEVFAALKLRYAEAPFTGTLNELKAENEDIDWNSISKYQTRQAPLTTLKAFLVEQGVLVEKDTSTETKLAEITEELKRRYPEGKKFSGTIEQLKLENKGLSISSINTWAMQVHQKSAKDYLIQVGVMAEAKTVEEKLADITATLKERYASGEKKAYTITDLREQNLDLPVGTIGTWSKKVFGQNATEYLTAQGILSEYDWMASARIENERREAREKAREERLRAEMSASVEMVYYKPEVYHVEEIDVCGEEAKDWKYKDDYYYHVGEIYIEDYLGDKDRIVIPTYINGKRVANLDAFGLKQCKASIVEIPGSFKKVAGHLGYQNTNIKTVIVGEGVEVIGEGCFSFVKSLTNVYVSQSVVHIEGDTAFKYTPWYEKQQDLVIVGSVLTEMKEDHAVLNVPHGIKTVGRLVAVFKSGLRKVILPETVTTLEESAFNGRGNENIQEFIYTDSLVNIGARALGENKWTESFGDAPVVINGQLYLYKNAGSTLVIPEGITKIGSTVFKENANIKTVVFPSTLVEIGEEAFSGCSNLTTIELPNGVVRLGKGCFYRCRKLKQVSLPDSLVEVGRSAFNSCASLTDVSVGANVEIIGEKAFVECKMLRSVQMNDKLRVVGPEAFEQCTLLKAVTLPETVTEIGNGAFRRCESLESINIPESVTTIQSSTFEGCKALASIKLHGGIAEIQSSAFAGCVRLESTNLPAKVGESAFTGCAGITVLAFNEKMTSIEKNCFSGCVNVTKIVIPEGVETIEAQAFYGCNNLVTAILPGSLKTIGGSAFYGCSSLKEVVIPNAVNTIGDNAFKDCASLEEVKMTNSIPNMGIDIFTNTPYMKKAFGEFVVMGGVLTKYLGTAADVVIPDSVTSIGENAFAEAKHVVSIAIPDSVKTISKKIMGTISSWSDDPKPKLQKLIIGNGVSVIGEEAFENCDELSEIVFGSQMTKICEKAFAGCKKLKCIDLEKTLLTEVAYEAFEGCYGVTRIVLPNTIEVIGRGAFSGISAGKVSLPKSVRKVERSAFSGATELVVYDTIDPDAKEAAEWQFDQWNGSINSALGAALLGVPGSYVECQGNTNWRGHHITVLSAITGKIRYRIFCDSAEREDYRSLMFSAWGKNASFMFERYDAYFAKTRSLAGRAEMAFCRVMYPEGLTDEHKTIYDAYLERCLYIERSARRIAEIIAKDDSVERLELLDNYKAIDAHNIAWLKETFTHRNAAQCKRYLEEHYSA